MEHSLHSAREWGSAWTKIYMKLDGGEAQVMPDPSAVDPAKDEKKHAALFQERAAWSRLPETTKAAGRILRRRQQRVSRAKVSWPWPLPAFPLVFLLSTSRTHPSLPFPVLIWAYFGHHSILPGGYFLWLQKTRPLSVRLLSCSAPGDLAMACSSPALFEVAR